MIWSQTARLAALDYVLWDYGASKKFRDAVRTKLTTDLKEKSRDKIDMTYLYGKMTYGEQSGDNFKIQEGLHHEPIPEVGDIEVSQGDGLFARYAEFELWNHKVTEYDQAKILYYLSYLLNNETPTSLQQRAQAEFEQFGENK